jgi:hypothetical protein
LYVARSPGHNGTLTTSRSQRKRKTGFAFTDDLINRIIRREYAHFV